MRIILVTIFYCCFLLLNAHPMPSSILNLDIGATAIKAEIQMPLSELQLAMNIDLGESPENQLDNYKNAIKDYLYNHIKIKNWNVSVGDLKMKDANQIASGDYKELNAEVVLTPNDIQQLRHFELYYDVILHQVVTHEILVAVRNDWQTGIYEENAVQLGVISLDIPTNTIKPFQVNCGTGSDWQGFVSIFNLGMSHIKEGTDHLLFLLVLLIPAPLLVINRRWASYIGTKKSLWKLLRIITAFTIGHSVTLLLGTIGWIPFSSQLIEIMIAFSILISAIHAIFPLFYNREAYIAAGFGLIHGLAFSDTLSNMPLTAAQMAWSILGFNLGIEIMQLFIMCLILPSFLVMCYFSSKNYQYFRIITAIISLIAAFAWLLERVLNTPNLISTILEKIPHYGIWIIGELAFLALISILLRKNTQKQ